MTFEEVMRDREEKGRREGKDQGVQLMKELIQYMNDAGQLSQIQRVLGDEAFFQGKLEELQQYKRNHSQ